MTVFECGNLLQMIIELWMDNILLNNEMGI